MKRIAMALAMVLLVIASYAQTTFTQTITIPQNVATQEWAQKYIAQKIDSAINAQKIAPILKPCLRGPTIGKFTAIANTNSLVQFDGEGVTEIDYVITGTTYYYKGHVQPKSSNLDLPYPQAPKGSYVLTLAATSCAGGDSKSFSIK